MNGSIDKIHVQKVNGILNRFWGIFFEYSHESNVQNTNDKRDLKIELEKNLNGQFRCMTLCILNIYSDSDSVLFVIQACCISFCWQTLNLHALLYSQSSCYDLVICLL